MSHLRSVACYAGAGLTSVGIGVGITDISDSHTLIFPVLAATLAAGAIAALTFYARRNDVFALVPLVAGFYLLAFGIGGIYYYTPGAAIGTSALLGFNHSYSTGGLVLATGIALIGLSSWMIGFFSSRPLDRLIHRIPRVSLKPDEIQFTFFVLLAIGWLARLIFIRGGLYFRYSDAARSGGSFGTLLAIATGLPLIATAMAGIARQRGKSMIGRTYWPLIALELGWALPSGVRAKLIGIGLLVIVVRYFASSDRFPWRSLALGTFVTLLVVFPFGALYRGSGGTSGYEHNSTAQLGRAATTLVENPANSVALGERETLSRFSDSASLATIVTQGRGAYPSKGTQTIKSWIEALVPRFLLPGKSNPSTVSNEFGRNYGVIRGSNATAAAIAPTQVGDFYGSFGWLGVTVGLLIAGALYRMLDQYLHDRRTDVLSLAIYAAIIGTLINRLETSFAVGFFQTVKEIAIYEFVIAVSLVIVRRRMPVAGTAIHGDSRSHQDRTHSAHTLVN